MSKYVEVSNARSGLWRNYAMGTTFSMCKKHKIGGKSMGCVKCFEEELAKLIGAKKAKKYHALVKEIRVLEDSMTTAEDE